MGFTKKAKKQLRELSKTSKSKKRTNRHRKKIKNKEKDLKKALVRGKLWRTRYTCVTNQCDPILFNEHTKEKKLLGIIDEFPSKKKLEELFGKGIYVAERYNPKALLFDERPFEKKIQDEKYQVSQIVYVYSCNYNYNKKYYAIKDLDFDKVVLNNEVLEKYSKYFLTPLPNKKKKIRKWKEIEVSPKLSKLHDIVSKEYNLYGGMIKETEGRAHVRDELKEIIKESNSKILNEESLIDNTLLNNHKDYDYRKFDYKW